jgi:hypothetical protein
MPQSEFQRFIRTAIRNQLATHSEAVRHRLE